MQTVRQKLPHTKKVLLADNSSSFFLSACFLVERSALINNRLRHTIKASKIEVTEMLLTRASNRVKYCSGLGSSSAKFIFNALAPVQVFRSLILQV